VERLQTNVSKTVSKVLKILTGSYKEKCNKSQWVGEAGRKGQVNHCLGVNHGRSCQPQGNPYCWGGGG